MVAPPSNLVSLSAVTSHTHYSPDLGLTRCRWSGLFSHAFIMAHMRGVSRRLIINRSSLQALMANGGAAFESRLLISGEHACPQSNFLSILEPIFLCLFVSPRLWRIWSNGIGDVRCPRRFGFALQHQDSQYPWTAGWFNVAPWWPKPRGPVKHSNANIGIQR